MIDPRINSTMMPKFDLSTLGGAQFTLATNDNIVQIKVLKSELVFEVIKAHTLLLDDPNCETTDLIDLFTGFVQTPYHITWVTTSNPNLPLERVVEQTIKEGNTLAVVEIIPYEDPDRLSSPLLDQPELDK